MPARNAYPSANPEMNMAAIAASVAGSITYHLCKLGSPESGGSPAAPATPWGTWGYSRRATGVQLARGWRSCEAGGALTNLIIGLRGASVNGSSAWMPAGALTDRPNQSRA